MSRSIETYFPEPVEKEFKRIAVDLPPDFYEKLNALRKSYGWTWTEMGKGSFQKLIEELPPRVPKPKQQKPYPKAEPNRFFPSEDEEEKRQTRMF